MAVKMEQSRSTYAMLRCTTLKRPWRGGLFRIVLGETGLGCQPHSSEARKKKKKQILASQSGMGWCDTIAAKRYHSVVAAWWHGVAG
jgi:hypothetical protein